MNEPNETGYAKRIRSAVTWRNVFLVLAGGAVVLAALYFFGVI